MTTETDRGTLAAFIERYGVTAEAQRITPEAFKLHDVGAWDDSYEQRDRTYWMVTLSREGGRAFAVPFSLGSSAWWKVRGTLGHRREGEANMARCRTDGERWPCTEVLRLSRLPVTDGNRAAVGGAQPEAPTAADLLDSLASDASGYDNARDFADWCGEYGYDTDSRTAERIYRTVAEQAKQLRALLGVEAYEELLWRTERE